VSSSSPLYGGREQRRYGSVGAAVERATPPATGYARPMTAATLLVALLLTAACDDGSTEPLFVLPEEPEELRLAEARWRSERPERYLYVIENQCFCSRDYTGPVRVWVEGDAVVARTYLFDGSPVPDELEGAFRSVDGLFELLREAYQSGAHEVRVTYDPALGVPTELWIDRDELSIDEELGVRVLEPVTPSD